MTTETRRYCRLSHPSEYECLENNTGTYDGIMVGAHMIATFGRQLISRLARIGKPYFVDPAIYRLALDTGQGCVPLQGNWMGNLVRRIDEAGELRALAARLEKGPLLPCDFGVGGATRYNVNLTRQLVAGTIGIQKGSDQTITGYMEPVGLGWGGGKAQHAPDFAVAPYFHARDVASDWFDVNTRLLDEAVRQEPGVYGVLCLDRDVLRSEGAVRRIVEAYSKAGGLLVWISGFDDTSESIQNLRRYHALLDGLADTGKSIIALHAGHYATILSTRIKISGIVRGLDMNGYKDAMGAGGPGQARYYLWQSHAHALKKLAAKVLWRKPKTRCVCSPCTDALSVARREGHSGEELFAAMIGSLGRNMLKEHFMHAQKSEMDHVSTNQHDTAAMVLGGLTWAELARLEEMGLSTGHIRRWLVSLT